MKNSVVLALAACLLLSACKKEEKTCRLGRITFSDGNTSLPPYVFSYDEAGRLVRLNYPNGNTDSLYYSNDSLYVFSKDDRDSLLSYTAGQLQGNNLGSGFRQYFDYLGNITNTEGIAAQYNSNGNLTALTLSNSNYTLAQSFSYTGNNRTGGERYNGTTLVEEYVIFRNTLENKTGFDELIDFTTPYYGKASANLADSMWVIAAGDTSKVQYSYTLDDYGYISKLVKTRFTPNTDTRYYTFQYFDCKE